MSHTPTPWTFGEDNDGWHVEYDGVQIAFGLTEENARRIVACVNACSAFETELLEAEAADLVTRVDKTRGEALERDVRIIELEQQRDQLVKALEDVRDISDGWIGGIADDIVVICESALAAAKGKA